MCTFLKDQLPPSFINEVECFSPNLIIRSNLKNLEDCDKWIKEYGRLTQTKWNSRTSKPLGERIVCSKKFVCHHSAFMKVSPEATKRSISKNSFCMATINIKVKLDTVVTRKRDPFVKKGLFAVITIIDTHNHSLNTAEALKFLPPSDCKDKFIDYFNDGLGIAEASKYHNGILQLEGTFTEVDMANSQVNPPYRTVQYWYNQWRVPDIRNTESGPVLPELVSTSYAPENNVSSSYDEKRQELLEEIFSLISQHDKKHKSSLSGLNKFVKKLKNVHSTGSWESFLHTAGNSVGVRRRNGASIKVQPRSIARRSALQEVVNVSQQVDQLVLPQVKKGNIS